MQPPRGEALLYAVGARRQLAWRAFTELLDGVFVADERVGHTVKEVRGAVARLGVSLGHWEVVPDKQSTRVCIAPPALALLPRPGLPAAVLCGSRSPDTLPAAIRAAQKIGAIIEAAPQEHLHPYAPMRIEATADSRQHLAQLASELNIAFGLQPSAWGIAMAGNSVDYYLASLEWVDGGDLNWPRRDFDPEALRLVPSNEQVRREGMVLSVYEHPGGWAREDRLWRGGSSAVANRDWGRFAVLADRGITVLRYDRAAGALSLPRQTPLPGIFARALGLCTGQPPKFEAGDGLGWHSYGGVPASIAKVVATKLGQTWDLRSPRSGSTE